MILSKRTLAGAFAILTLFAPAISSANGGGAAARLIELLSTRTGLLLLESAPGTKLVSRIMGRPLQNLDGDIELFAYEIAKQPELADELNSRVARIIKDVEFVVPNEGFRLDRLRMLAETGLKFETQALGQIGMAKKIAFVDELPESSSTYAAVKAQFIGDDTEYLAGKLSKIHQSQVSLENITLGEEDLLEFMKQIMLTQKSLNDLKVEALLSGATPRVVEANRQIALQNTLFTETINRLLSGPTVRGRALRDLEDIGEDLQRLTTELESFSESLGLI